MDKHGREHRERISNPNGEPYIGDDGEEKPRDGAWMDAERKRIVAREYLTHIGEAKEWIEACIQEDLPAITDLEERLRNGVILAKLARFFSKESVRKIHDESQKEPLNLRHSDNFNSFAVACRKVGLPKTYFFELTDLYDMKNMPKVVYMIHALSHYLTKLGLAPQINNLMGQLFFTDEELERTAKGLGNIQMPAFKDIGASLDKEMGGVEKITEEEKIRRETRELASQYESQTRDLLAWIAKASAELNSNNFDATDYEKVSQLTAEFNDYLTEKVIREDRKDTLLQKYQTIVEKLASKDLGDYECPSDVLPAVVLGAWDALLQAEAARQKALALTKKTGQYNEQAGELVQWLETTKVKNSDYDHLPHSVSEVEKLIAAHESYKAEKESRRRHQEELSALFNGIKEEQEQLDMITFQPIQGRSTEEIAKSFAALDEIDAHRDAALAKGLENARRREAYDNHATDLIQWIAKAKEAYDERSFPENLAQVREMIAQLELDRSQHPARYAQLEEITKEFAGIQKDMEFHPLKGKSPPEIVLLYEQLEIAAQNRAFALSVARQQLEDSERAKHFRDNEDKIAQLQANIRGLLYRKAWKERMQAWKDRESLIAGLQAHGLGFLVRRRIKAMKDYYKSHEAKITKIQALARGRAARKQYKNFTELEDTPVDTIQRFLHLLDDSDRDFDEEIELERLKELVVYNIRDNNDREKELSSLDIKIALLIKNRTSLEDVVETTAEFKKKMKRDATETGNLKTLDREARQKLEGYQHLFYLLQTEPAYLAKLLFRLKIQDKVQKFVETIVLTLFGYAQNAREEYLLLRLFQHAVREEMSQVTDPQDIVKGNPVFIKLVVHYNRGAKELQFLRDLLQPLVKDVLERSDLDLDVDPLSIYRNMIKDEESRTGQKSTLAYDVSRTQALENDEVMKIFVRHLRDLKSITNKFLTAIVDSLPKMPYGIRYIASVMYKDLREKFPEAEEELITKTIGNLIYYRYLNPAIVAPEGFDVIESVISSVQRKNLAEISKMLQQISVNKLFDNEEDVYLTALNEYIGAAKNKFYDFFRAAAQVQSPEEHFQIDGKFDDLTRTHKPTIYISTEELYSTHALLLENIDDVAPSKTDPLRVILTELGPPPEGSASQVNRGQEISLILTNKFADVDSTEMVNKRLFVLTKRYCLNVIRVQRGVNLRDILESPILPEQLKLYELQLERELQIKSDRATKQPMKKSPTIEDFADLTLAELKKKALENMVALEKVGMVSKANNYQEMLNSIAKDIRNKNRRRIQRRAELTKMRQTLSHLQEKTAYLEEQKKSYMDYVNSCIGAMQDKNKKNKRKTLVLPFTQQYTHLQELKRSGKTPKFGSFQYTAERLFQKGVLVELKDVSEKQRNLVVMTISSDEVGVFQISGKFLGVTMETMEIRLEDLLQKQFDNVQVITILNTAKVNVNLLVFLLNKKFFV